MKNAIATYADAVTAGYRNHRQSWQRGYVSRRTNLDAQPIKYDRYGNPYVLLPSWQSTRYCVRQYLQKTAAGALAS